MAALQHQIGRRLDISMVALVKMNWLLSTGMLILTY